MFLFTFRFSCRSNSSPYFSFLLSWHQLQFQCTCYGYISSGCGSTCYGSTCSGCGSTTTAKATATAASPAPRLLHQLLSRLLLLRVLHLLLPRLLLLRINLLRLYLLRLRLPLPRLRLHLLRCSLLRLRLLLPQAAPAAVLYQRCNVSYSVCWSWQANLHLLWLCVMC